MEKPPFLTETETEELRELLEGPIWRMVVQKTFAPLVHNLTNSVVASARAGHKDRYAVGVLDGLFQFVQGIYTAAGVNLPPIIKSLQRGA